jgi:hypothetical protein
MTPELQVVTCLTAAVLVLALAVIGFGWHMQLVERRTETWRRHEAVRGWRATSERVAESVIAASAWSFVRLLTIGGMSSVRIAERIRAEEDRAFLFGSGDLASAAEPDAAELVQLVRRDDPLDHRPVSG